MTDQNAPALKRMEANPDNPPADLVFQELRRSFPQELEIAMLRVSNQILRSREQQAAAGPEDED